MCTQSSPSLPPSLFCLADKSSLCPISFILGALPVWRDCVSPTLMLSLSQTPLPIWSCVDPCRLCQPAPSLKPQARWAELLHLVCACVCVCVCVCNNQPLLALWNCPVWIYNCVGVCVCERRRVWCDQNPSSSMSLPAMLIILLSPSFFLVISFTMYLPFCV